MAPGKVKNYTQALRIHRSVAKTEKTILYIYIYYIHREREKTAMLRPKFWDRSLNEEGPQFLQILEQPASRLLPWPPGISICEQGTHRHLQKSILYIYICVYVYKYMSSDYIYPDSRHSKWKLTNKHTVRSTQISFLYISRISPRCGGPGNGSLLAAHRFPAGLLAPDKVRRHAETLRMYMCMYIYILCVCTKFRWRRHAQALKEGIRHILLHTASPKRLLLMAF